MKKLFSTLCISLCLLFSSTATAVWADDGNGHDPGYVCVETVTAPTPICLPGNPPQQQQSGETSVSNDEEGADTFLILLDQVIALLP